LIEETNCVPTQPEVESYARKPEGEINQIQERAWETVHKGHKRGEKLARVRFFRFKIFFVSAHLQIFLLYGVLVLL
jgi:hypothetical protein